MRPLIAFALLVCIVHGTFTCVTQFWDGPCDCSGAADNAQCANGGIMRCYGGVCENQRCSGSTLIAGCSCNGATDGSVCQDDTGDYSCVNNECRPVCKGATYVDNCACDFSLGDATPCSSDPTYSCLKLDGGAKPECIPYCTSFDSYTTACTCVRAADSTRCLANGAVCESWSCKNPCDGINNLNTCSCVGVEDDVACATVEGSAAISARCSSGKCVRSCVAGTYKAGCTCAQQEAANNAICGVNQLCWNKACSTVCNADTLVADCQCVVSANGALCSTSNPLAGGVYKCFDNQCKLACSESSELIGCECQISTEGSKCPTNKACTTIGSSARSCIPVCMPDSYVPNCVCDFANVTASPSCSSGSQKCVKSTQFGKNVCDYVCPAKDSNNKCSCENAANGATCTSPSWEGGEVGNLAAQCFGSICHNLCPATLAQFTSYSSTLQVYACDCRVSGDGTVCNFAGDVCGGGVCSKACKVDSFISACTCFTAAVGAQCDSNSGKCANNVCVPKCSSTSLLTDCSCASAADGASCRADAQCRSGVCVTITPPPVIPTEAPTPAPTAAPTQAPVTRPPTSPPVPPTTKAPTPAPVSATIGAKVTILLTNVNGTAVVTAFNTSSTQIVTSLTADLKAYWNSPSEASFSISLKSYTASSVSFVVAIKATVLVPADQVDPDVWALLGSSFKAGTKIDSVVATTNVQTTLGAVAGSGFQVRIAAAAIDSDAPKATPPVGPTTSPVSLAANAVLPSVTAFALLALAALL